MKLDFMHTSLVPCRNLLQRRFPNSQSGLTLVELMVAMVIGLFLVSVIATLFVGAKQTYRTQDNLSRLQENGRFAMEMLGRNIRDAGYTSISFAPPANLYAPPSATSFSGTAITGSNGTTDTITVSYDAVTDCFGANVPSGRVVNVFSINSSNQLICFGNGSVASQAMLDDVEDMQIFYGENLGATHRYVPAGTSGLNMGNVDTMRVCVLIRSSDDNVAPESQTYINCSGTSVTAADRRVRRAFTATFNLRNRTL